MNRPSCPEHQDLVLDLARGRLDDRAAAGAEKVRRSCPVCAAWWHEHLEGETAAAVDDAIAAALTGLALPRRRAGRGWLAAAAALVMALGAAGLWLAQRPEQTASPAPQLRVAAIEAFDFESPAARPELVVSEPGPLEAEPALLVEVSEPSFPTAVGEVRVAAVTPTRTAIAEADSAIFAGNFESGDLGGWVPGT